MNTFKKNCNCGDGIVPAKQPLDKSCACKPAHVTFRTKLIPASLGDDTGEYKPEPGSAFDTLVIYQENGAIYFYDSNGVFTKIRDGWLDDFKDSLEALVDQMNELYDPIVAHTEVESYAELLEVKPGTVPSDAYVSVRHDETHDELETLWSYDAKAKQWVFEAYASPYYTKDVIDFFVKNLNTRLDEEAEARREADEAEAEIRQQKDADLDAALTKETEDREAADKEINDRIEDIQNSPDVRFIVDTYADLTGLEKSGIGDKDYARVLQDETHEGASTYYQFDLGTQTWNYVGMTGPYYTKQEIDDKLEGMPGVLSSYTESPEPLNVYSAKYINDKLNSTVTRIGSGATGSGASVAIGWDAAAGSGGYGVAVGARATASNSGSVAIGSSTLSTQIGAKANSAGAIAIGTGTEATQTYSIAIGQQAQSNNPNSVAIGSYSRAGRANEFSIGNTEGLGTAPTRYLANVKAGTLDTDAVNLKQMKDYVEENGGGKLYSEYGDNEDGSLTQKFVSEKLNSNKLILGVGNTNAEESSTSSVGNAVILGSNNSITSKQNVSGNNAVVIGTEAKVQTSYTTQNRTTHIRAVAIGYQTSVTTGGAFPTSVPGVAIGDRASVSTIDGDGAIAIGNQAYATSNGVAIGPAYAWGGYYKTQATGGSAIALGPHAQAKHSSSVAIGRNAVTGRAEEVSIGSGNDPEEKEDYPKNPHYRFLANVRDGELPHDAVNKQQLDEAVGNINILLETLISGEGAK